MERITKQQIIANIKGSDEDELKNALNDKELETFAELAEKGQDIDLFKGLQEMVTGYLDNTLSCTGMHTSYYDAGWSLFNKFMETDHPLAQKLRKEGKRPVFSSSEIQRQFNKYYGDELNEYDIDPIDWKQYLKNCMEEFHYYGDQLRTQALCYGIYLFIMYNLNIDYEA